MTEVTVWINAHEAPSSLIKEIADLVEQYPGESWLYLSIETSEGVKTYRLGQKINYCAEFYLAMHDLIGVDLNVDTE